jgi:hypothetical protein
MAQCPQCGSHTQIPLPGQQPPANEISTLKPDDSSSPFDSHSGPNPYQTSRPTSQDNPENVEYAKARVSGPAIGLIVTGSLLLLMLAGSLISTLVLPAPAQIPIFANNPQNAQPMPNFVMPQIDPRITMANEILDMGFAVLIIVGGIKMLKLENYALSMAAAIVAMIPCCSSCCCLIGLPMGIWALVALNDPNVKIAFK